MGREMEFAQNLIDFIYDSPTQYHSIEKAKELLGGNGFIELSLSDVWKLEKNKSYFTVKNGSALIAFKTGEGNISEEGFKIVGAHTDAPTFRIKSKPEIVSENRFLKLNTEVYGGPILSTWLDRPLSIAGRVSLKGENPLKPRVSLIKIDKPILVIPNIAIHMNREVNKGVELNRQKDMLPLLGDINESLEKDNFLVKLLSKELNVDADEILDFDLYLYEFEKGKIVGINEEYISSGKLDDLAMVHAGLNALIEAKAFRGISVLCLFDNEEVGSQTKQGAGSPLLAKVLERICLSFGEGREGFFRAIENSFLISADMAHSAHPNVPEKCDPTNRPVLNRGPVIKIAASQAYTTDSDSCAVFEGLCMKANVPYQKFFNRSDERGGSTIGPITAGQLDIRSVDIGNPTLAMHSVRELSGVYDHFYVKEVFSTFFSL